jgi:hypothetical protein
MIAYVLKETHSKILGNNFDVTFCNNIHFLYKVICVLSTLFFYVFLRCIHIKHDYVKSRSAIDVE